MERWAFLTDYKAEVNELIGYYLTDITSLGGSLALDLIGTYKSLIIPRNYLDEIKSLADQCDFSEDEVLLANLYYDAVKFAFGCTAFAIHDGKTVWHARNLDWWTENGALSKYSAIFHFQRDGSTVYKTVGWPGFIGALSGMKPGSFALTLNAVVSNESPGIANPVSFLLRDVLENCQSFEEAQQKLSHTNIISDCLLLLSGTKEGEMVVIERTPTKHYLRQPSTNSIVVTNDYKGLDLNVSEGQNTLQETSCGRYDGAERLLSNRNTFTAEACFEVLSHRNVKMDMTVQQMAFNTENDVMELRTPVYFAD